MTFFGLTLSPLTLILLLAFLWFILLVLLLWTWLRPQTKADPELQSEPKRRSRRSDPAEERTEIGRTKAGRAGQRKLEPDPFEDEPAKLPRPRTVREVPSKPQDDAFEGFDPNKRRDDFDF